MTTTPAARFLRSLAEWAAVTRFDTSGVSFAEARRSLLDTLACLQAGRDQPQTRKTMAAMLAGAAGARLSVPAVALVNGTAAHALDFDDYEVPGSTHPSAPVFGALLALADVREVTLGALLEAYLKGYETIVRLGEALGYPHYLAGWHATSTIGVFGAAAASARLLGLGTTGIVNALSLASSQAAGLKTQFGSDVKALHAGFAARAGVESALLAEAGIEANAAVLDGAFGFFARYSGHGSPGFETPLARLGRVSGIEEYPVLRKPWPCCAYTHRAIEAAMRLAARPGFDVAELRAVRVRVPEPFARVPGFSAPGTPAEARFSIVWCVAACLHDGAIGNASFEQTAIDRPAVRDLLARVSLDGYDPGPGLSDMSPQAPDTVRITLASGECFEETVAEVLGGMTRPLSEAALLAKFLDCGGSPQLADRVVHGDTATPFRVQPMVARDG